MRCIFELRRRFQDGTQSLIGSVEEDCHVDAVVRRAKALLWTLPLPDRQDLVIVRRVESGHEIYRNAIGTSLRLEF